MLFGNLCAAYPCALEAGGLDQSRRMVVRGIAEHRTGIRQLQRLRRHAPFKQFLHALARHLGIPGWKTKPGGGKDLIGGTLQPGMAIADGEILGAAHDLFATPV